MALPAGAVLFPEKVLLIFAEQRVVREPFDSTCVECFKKRTKNKQSF